MRRMAATWAFCGAVLAFGSGAEAQFGRRPFVGAPCNSGCGSVYVPQVAPNPCAVSQPIIQTQLQPVVQTYLQPQQVLTYRDVAATQYRQEQFAVQVPVTTVQQVTRDEGSYQMVWVPRLVTHQAPQTTYQTQIAYRTVPYQVTQRVAQLETRVIPQQTVQYIPQTTIAGGCCGQTGIFQQALLPGASYGVIPQSSAMAVPSSAPAIQSTTAPQQQLVPNPPTETSMHSEWKSVEPRHALAPTDTTTSMLPSAALIQARPASWSAPR